MTSLLGYLLTVLTAAILKQQRNPSFVIFFSCPLIMRASLLTSTEHLFFLKIKALNTIDLEICNYCIIVACHLVNTNVEDCFSMHGTLYYLLSIFFEILLASSVLLSLVTFCTEFLIPVLQWQQCPQETSLFLPVPELIHTVHIPQLMNQGQLTHLVFSLHSYHLVRHLSGLYQDCHVVSVFCVAQGSYV